MLLLAAAASLLAAAGPPRPRSRLAPAVRLRAVRTRAEKTAAAGVVGLPKVPQDKRYTESLGDLLEDAAGKWNFSYANVKDRRAKAEHFMRTNPQLPPLKICILGKPASGKGTIAPMVATAFRVANIGAGNLLRAEVRTGSRLGRVARAVMEKGELVPDDIMGQLIANRISQPDAQANGWLLDGFPRSEAQAKFMIEYGLEPDVVIVLDRPDELCQAMLLGRMTDTATGAIYHPVFSPPPSDVEHRLVWRLDDHQPTLIRRLLDHQRSIDSILAAFDHPLCSVKNQDYCARTKIIDNARSEISTFDDVSSFLKEVAHQKAKRLEQQAKQALEKEWVPLDARDYAREKTEVAKRIEWQRFDPLLLDAAGAGGEDVEALCGLGEDDEACEIRLDMLDIRPTSLLDAVQRCNEFDPSEYAPVFVENQQVGFASEDLVRKLRGFTTGVEIAPNPNMYYTKGDQTVLSSNAIFLAPEVSNLRERTGVMEALIDELIIDGTIPPEKVRNELQDIYPLDSGWTGEPLLKIERAAMTYFGIPSYAAHVNGYVADAKTGRPSALWLGRRALSKPTYPGLLDQIAAGGQPAGMSFDENVRKECLEEASLSADVLEGLRPAGMVSYRYSTRRGLSTKTIAVYDLQLPDDVFPSNGDGEVDEFILMPMDEVMRSLKDELPKWKPNSALVAVDFLVRHGFVGPDDADYIEITHLLRAASPPRSS